MSLQADRKGIAAAAFGGGVWVFDGKAGMGKVFGEIERAAGDDAERGFIDDDFGGVLREDAVVIGGRGVIEREFILKARAAATFYRNAKTHRLALRLPEGMDARGRAG